MTTRIEVRQDQLRQRRERRNLTRKARERREVLRYCFFALLLFVAVYVVKAVPWSISNPEFDIEISGNHVVSNEQIRQVLQDSCGVPLFFLDPQKLAKKVESLEDVRHAFVRRCVIPKPHLVVQVLEEFPFASYSSSPDKPVEAVVSQTGRLIPLAKFPNVEQPKLRMFGPVQFRLSEKQVGQWSDWCSLIAAQTGQTVDFIDLRSPYDVRVGNGDLYLKLGSADTGLTKRLGRLASVMPTVEPLRSKLEYIDLGLDNNIPLRVSKKSVQSGSTTGSGSVLGTPFERNLTVSAQTAANPDDAATSQPAVGNNDTSIH
jgi:cell division septal protein FtsQ